jgi:pyruvate ferredoxin oxidoreductase gamma subunit
VRDRLQLHSGKIICLDAVEIANKYKSRINIPMFAVMAHALGFPDDKMTAAIEKSWPKAKEANLAAYNAASAECSFKDFPADGKYALVPPNYSTATSIGWKTQEIGAVVENTEHLNIRGTGGMRAGLIPVYNREACIDCVKCFFTCPDPGSVVFKDGKMVGIDYDFCKGCLRCIYVCPETKKGKALVEANESDHLEAVAANAAGQIAKEKAHDTVNV